MEHDRTNHLRQITMTDRPGAVVAVASGKGGVGKTNIAVNLALCLASSGKKVLLFDADLGLGNVDILMNIDCRFTIENVLSGRKNLRDIICDGPAGLEVICTGCGLQHLADATQFQINRLVTELAELQNNNDIIIIDTGAGINRSVTGFCLAADHTLVVTTPEPAAITDAYAMIKVLTLQNYTGQISLIVNMANSIAEGKRVFYQVSRVAQRFLGVSIYDAGVLCRDDKLVAAVKKRIPVTLAYPKTRITSSFVSIASRLYMGTKARRDGEGFFRKVVNWFF